jgi:hypothetical protein
MKKAYLIITIAFTFNSLGIAQTFQDAEGESSVLLPFGSVTLNTKAPNLSLSYYYGVPTLGVGINLCLVLK